MLLTQGAPTKPIPLAEKYLANGIPDSATVKPGVILDVADQAGVTWTIPDEGGETVESYLYHEASDGTRSVRGGGVVDAGTGYNFQASIDAWEPETPLVKLVIVTTVTYSDGSVKATETYFYKYAEPSPPGPSLLDIFFPAEPWFESTEINFTVQTDHNRTATERILKVGLQRFPVTDGGTQQMPLTIKAGAHQATVFAAYKDGTSSESNPLTVTVQGGVSPAEQAELEAVVDQRMRDNLIGSQATNLHTINEQVAIGVELFNAGQPWMLGQHTSIALTAEKERWQDIFDDPDVSDSSKAMADSAIQNLTLIIGAAQLSAAAYSPPLDLNGAFRTTASMQLGYVQYFDWIRSVPTTPFIMVI